MVLNTRHMSSIINIISKNKYMEKQDLRYLSWTKIKNSCGIAGSFLKAYSDLGGKKVYYKLSNYDSVNGITGHECINEIIVDRLLTILGIEHLSYQLIYADILIDDIPYTTWLCASNDFKRYGESKLALDDYYQVERLSHEKPLDFCIRKGWKKYIWEMLVVDYLILNRDRHGANIEVLRNSKNKTIRLAPLFDHGLSLLFSCHDIDEVNKVDVLEDKPVQCFVGSNSAFENLKLIPVKEYPKLNPIHEDDKAILFEDLDLDKRLLDKIWEMIWKRWCIYEDICDKR